MQRDDKHKKILIKDPLAGVFVPITFWCGICKKEYKEVIEQSKLRRMPRFVEFNGVKTPTRRPDGTINKACKDCVDIITADIERRRRKKIFTLPGLRND